MMLGGRAAESLTQDDICTGAVSDLKRATEVARGMVTKFGMSDKIGTVYLSNDQEVFVGMEFGQTRAYSEETAALIDDEVRAILTKCYADAQNILKEHIDQLNGLGELLIEKETVTRADFLNFISEAEKPEEKAEEPALPSEEDTQA